MDTNDRGENAAPRIQVVAPRDWTARIDEWRRKQPHIPSRSEAIRRLADIGLEREAAQ